MIKWAPEVLSPHPHCFFAFFSYKFMERKNSSHSRLRPERLAGLHLFLALIGIAGLLEFFGGLLLLVGFPALAASRFLLSERWPIGLISRPICLKDFWPMKNDGESAVFFLLRVFLFSRSRAEAHGLWTRC